jgi:hypothetical protein
MSRLLFTPLALAFFASGCFRAHSISNEQGRPSHGDRDAMIAAPEAGGSGNFGYDGGAPGIRALDSGQVPPFDAAAAAEASQPAEGGATGEAGTSGSSTGGAGQASGGASYVDAGDSGPAVEPSYCRAFVDIWRGVQEGTGSSGKACRQCFADVSERCAVGDRYDGCPANSACVRRNCICNPGTTSGDCADRTYPEDLCACVDSCMTPGPSECHNIWYEHIQCFSEACADVCGTGN